MNEIIKYKQIKSDRIALKKQIKEWLEPIRNLNLKVHCGGCNRKVNFWHMYKCFYCGFLFCKDCAKEHFEIKNEL